MNNQAREAVAISHSVSDMEASIDELLSNGFDRAEISLLASEETVRQKFGAEPKSTRELEDNPEAPFVPYLARESFGSLEGYAIGLPLYVGAIVGFVPVLASGGAIAAAIAAAAAAGGGGMAIGGILAYLIGKHHADFLEHQLEHGGILLWVRTRDETHEKRAVEILKRHSGDDVHVHGLPDRTSQLRKSYEAVAAKVPGAKLSRINYQDIEIIVAPDGHSLAAGRLFASLAEAKQYVNRVQAEQ